MSFPARTTLQLIHEALVAGYNGAPLATGGLLTAAQRPDLAPAISDETLPYLLFDLGKIAFSDWQNWSSLSQWDVPARLKVKGEPGEVDRLMLSVVQDLLLRTRSIYGLPVNEAGEVISFSDATADLFDEDNPKLMFLAERGAPVIKSVVFQPSKGPYAEADIIFGVSSVLDFDPRKLRPMLAGVLGTDPRPPGELYEGERGVRLLIDEDRQAVVSPIYPDPRDTIRSVNVTPYQSALSAAAPTVQLTAIAFYATGASKYVQEQAAWSSTNGAVATVSSSGLVTRTGAGSCSISCIFDGITSGVVSIICS